MLFGSFDAQSSSLTLSSRPRYHQSHIWRTIFKWIQMGHAARCNNLPASFFMLILIPLSRSLTFSSLFCPFPFSRSHFCNPSLSLADGNIQIPGHAVLVRTSQAFSSQYIFLAEAFNRENWLHCTKCEKNLQVNNTPVIKWVGIIGYNV